MAGPAGTATAVTLYAPGHMIEAAAITAFCGCSFATWRSGGNPYRFGAAVGVSA